MGILDGGYAGTIIKIFVIRDSDDLLAVSGFYKMSNSYFQSLVKRLNGIGYIFEV
jgi:hypothetical protein